MSLSRDNFLSSYLKELQADEIPFVLLHAYEDFPQNVRSDLDYAVRVQDLGRILPAVRRAADLGGWRLVHTIESHIYSLNCVLVKADEPGQFVQLDSCSHYVEAGCFFFRDAQLLQGRVVAGGLFIPAPAAEFGYLVAKGFAKGKQMELLLPKLHLLAERDPSGCAERLLELFGPPHVNLGEWLKHLASDQQALRSKLLNRKRFGFANRLREFNRALSRIARPKGLHLAVVGAGSYNPEELLTRLAPKLQGPLFRSTKIRRLKEPANPGSLKGYFKEVLPLKVRNGLIISTWNCPEPDAPALSHARIPHVDLTCVISAQSQNDQPNTPAVSDDPRVVFVSANQPLEEVADFIYRRALDFLASRETT